MGMRSLTTLAVSVNSCFVVDEVEEGVMLISAMMLKR